MLQGWISAAWLVFLLPLGGVAFNGVFHVLPPLAAILAGDIGETPVERLRLGGVLTRYVAFGQMGKVFKGRVGRLTPW